MSEDLLAKLQGLLGEGDLATKVHELLGGAGGFDPGRLLAGLQANPGLLGQLTEKLGPDPLAALQGLLPGGAGGPDLGGLGGLLGGAGGQGGPDLGALGDTLGGLLGGGPKA